MSFSSRNSRDTGNEGEKDHLRDPPLPLPQVLDDVDRFLNNTHPPCASAGEVPDCVLVLPKLLNSMVDKYNTGNGGRGGRINKLGQDPQDDHSFLDAVDRISKLTSTLSLNGHPVDKTSSALENAMCIIERDLCALLLHPKQDSPFQSKTRAPKKSSSSGSLTLLLQDHDNESPRPPNHLDAGDEDLPTFSAEKLSILNKIATAMISAGYETECFMAFAYLRRNAFKAALQKLGYASVRMEEVYKMQWESLEREIATWNKVVRHCTTVLFNAERRLYDSVFPNQPCISQGLFSDLARAVIIHFLNFAQAAVLTKPSPEKLFKLLDMYETLRDVEPGILHDSHPERYAEELAHEIAAAKDRIVEAVVAMFCHLENSIKGDHERIPVPNGAVHPLTRYVMNYLKYACESYKDTLEQVFQRYHSCLTDLSSDRTQNEENTTTTDLSTEVEEVYGTPKNNSPFALQLMTIMNLLDANIEKKSRLYRDLALRYIFLMNNGRYMAQRIKECADLHESVGDNWCRRRRSGLRLYHKSYQRETWSKVLQVLNPDGLQQQGNKVSKQVLKERFKCFNAMFEEILKTQSGWMVCDEQLQSELRVSISALVIPAYRSFHGRFKHFLESVRHIDKYIKYHPEDIETLIDHLFDGNATSMARRGT